MADIEVAKGSARGSLFLLAGNATSLFVLAVATVVIARLLGPTLYGLYTLAFVVPSIFVTVTGLGVNLAVTKYVATYLAKGEVVRAKEVTRSGVLFLVTFGGGLAGFVYLSGGFFAEFVLHRPELTALVQLASLLVLGQAVLQSADAALLGWGSVGIMSMSLAAQAILKLVMAVALVLAGYGVTGVVLGHAASYLIAGALATVILYTRSLHGIQPGPSHFVDDVKELLRYGASAYAGNIVFSLAMLSVLAILAIIATNTVVGLYQIANGAAEALIVAYAAISNSLFRAFASLDGLKADTVLAFKYALKYVSILMIPMTAFLVAAARPLVYALIGASFSSGIPYLQLLILATIPLAIGTSVIQPYFNGLGKARYTMNTLLVGATLLLVLAPALGILAGLGVYGLIFAQFISNIAILATGLALVTRRLRGTMDSKSLGGTALAAAAASGVVYFLSVLSLPPLFCLILDLAAFSLTYLTLAPLLHVVDESDLARLTLTSQGLGVFARLAESILGYERTVIALMRGRRRN